MSKNSYGPLSIRFLNQSLRIKSFVNHTKLESKPIVRSMKTHCVAFDRDCDIFRTLINQDNLPFPQNLRHYLSFPPFIPRLWSQSIFQYKRAPLFLCVLVYECSSTEPSPWLYSVACKSLKAIASYFSRQAHRIDCQLLDTS